VEKSFFQSLFDFSFSSFITINIVKVLYILALLAAGIAGLIGIGGGVVSVASGRVLAGLASIALAPIFFAVYVLLARVWLEVIVVLFRVAENTNRIAENTRR
jgi:hypothetical protein